MTNLTDDEILATWDWRFTNNAGIVAFARRMVALGAEAEREACADLCHKFIWAHGDVAKLCEDAIRARSET